MFGCAAEKRGNGVRLEAQLWRQVKDGLEIKGIESESQER
jgi:hypothetical protein